LAAAKDDDSERDQDEGEQRADVGEVGGIANVHEACGNAYGETGDPGGNMRRLESWVHR